MPPPKPPTLGTMRDTDSRAFLEALREARRTAGVLEAQLRRRCLHRAALEVFRAEIDEMAGLITGDRTHFHGRNTTPASEPQRNE